MTEDQEQPGLFAVDIPPAPEPAPDPYEGMSTGRKVTAKRLARLRDGHHPITGLPLHAEAAPVDDRQADGRRCEGCIFRRQRTLESGSWWKCFHNPGNRKTPLHVTGGAATDVPAWLPGCTAHERRGA